MASGFDEDRIHEKLLSYGFSPFRYHPENHKLEDLNGIRNRHKNTIYLRNNFEFNNKLTFIDV